MSALRLAVACAGFALVLNGPAAAVVDDWTYVPYEPLPASYDDLPMGEPTTLPWLEDGRLHLGDRTIRTGGKTVLVGSGETLVLGKGRYSVQHTKGWSIVVDGRLERLPSKEGATTREPYVSGNGRWIGWIDTWRTPINETPEQTINRVKQRIVVYDALKHRIATLRHEIRRSESGDGSNELWLHGLNNRGQALISWGEAGDHVLSRFQQRGYLAKLKVKGLYSSEQESYPRGVQLTDYMRNGEETVFGRVAEMGRFTELGQLPGYVTGEWSPRGGHFVDGVYSESGTTFVAYRVAEGHAYELGVPAVDEHIGVVGWESETTVVLWRTSSSYDDEADVSFLVRCDVVSTDCERVPNGPAAGDIVDFP